MNDDRAAPILPFPAPPEPEPDWVGMAIEKMDLNRFPPSLRESAAALLRGWAADRGESYPRAAKVQGGETDDA